MDSPLNSEIRNFIKINGSPVHKASGINTGSGKAVPHVTYKSYKYNFTVTSTLPSETLSR